MGIKLKIKEEIPLLRLLTLLELDPSEKLEFNYVFKIENVILLFDYMLYSIHIFVRSKEPIAME